MQCLRGERIGQGLAVDVGCDQRAIERRVLVDGAVAELRHRGVVHRVDRQVMVAVSEPPAPSLAVKVKLSVPLKFGFGV